VYLASIRTSSHVLVAGWPLNRSLPPLAARTRAERRERGKCTLGHRRVANARRGAGSWGGKGVDVWDRVRG